MVRLNKVKFYLYRVRQFANFLNNIPLHECSKDDVKVFLEKLQERHDIQDWQVKQAGDAVRLMLKEYLKVPWAVTGTSYDQTVKAQRTSGLLPVLSEKVTHLSEKEALEKLRTEIRYRHYSIRTERTYEQWGGKIFDLL